MVILYQVFYILHIDRLVSRKFSIVETYFNINFNLQSQQYDFFFSIFGKSIYIILNQF